MTEQLQHSGRQVATDKAIASDLTGAVFRNYQFLRLVARKKKFTDCDFSFSTFDSAYLRKCIFDFCIFVGCKFSSSNLLGCEFSGCKFDYAEFSHTLIEPEILESGLPGPENLQQKFARTLRTNFQQIGDLASVNKAIQIELEGPCS